MNNCTSRKNICRALQHRVVLHGYFHLESEVTRKLSVKLFSRQMLHLRKKPCPGVSLRFCIRRGIVATDALEISMYQVGSRQPHGETCRFLNFRILYASALRYLPLVVDIMRRKLEEKCLSCDPLRVGQSIFFARVIRSYKRFKSRDKSFREWSYTSSIVILGVVNPLETA